MTEPQHQKDGKCDISSNEVRHVPETGDECLVTIRYSDDRNNGQRPDGHPGLTPWLERKSVAHVVECDSTAESEVCYEAADPSQEARDGADVGEPGEDVS